MKTMHEDKPTEGYEIRLPSPEIMTVIGREIPPAREVYSSLSHEKDIVARVTESPVRVGTGQVLVSEKELFDDLLDFCNKCRSLPVESDDDQYGRMAAVRNTDTFLDTMVYMTKEMYTEATQGFAAHHSAWLEEKPANRVIFVVPDERKGKSQAAVSESVANCIPIDLIDRVDQLLVSELTSENITADTKLVLSDDWSITGNHIANDLAKLLKKLSSLYGIDADNIKMEINLLLARKDQVESGIRTLRRMKEDFPVLDTNEPRIVAYFETPFEKKGFGGTTSPTGSHSSADYDFSQTLHSMYVVASSHGKADRMPYIATIVPEYSNSENRKGK